MDITPSINNNRIENLFAFTEFNIGEFVEPMIWEYQPTDRFSLDTSKFYPPQSRSSSALVFISYHALQVYGRSIVAYLIRYGLHLHSKEPLAAARYYHLLDTILEITRSGWTWLPKISIDLEPFVELRLLVGVGKSVTILWQWCVLCWVNSETEA